MADRSNQISQQPSISLECIEEHQTLDCTIGNEHRDEHQQALHNAPPEYQQEEPDEIVQVVYQSNPSGSLVGVESSLLSGSSAATAYDTNLNHHYQQVDPSTVVTQSISGGPQDELAGDSGDLIVLQQQSRATSTLPSVAEESSSGGYPNDDGLVHGAITGPDLGGSEHGGEATSRSVSRANEEFDDQNRQQDYIYANQEQYQPVVQYDQPISYYNQQQPSVNPLNPNVIYFTINKQRNNSGPDDELQSSLANNDQYLSSTNQGSTNTDESFYTALCNQNNVSTEPSNTLASHNSGYFNDATDGTSTLQLTKHSTLSELQEEPLDGDDGVNNKINEDAVEKESSWKKSDDGNEEEFDADITHILARQKQGAAESGSFRHNFRKKKLVVSSSTNENDLTAHRQKLLQSQEAPSHNDQEEDQDGEPGSLPTKFKRTHSVSFNVHSSRNSRHSVDIRNLPSYLTVKRASIVDVAKGAMSSLMHSFGSSSGSQRRDSSPDEEPIFEEPIAPTLSLGQRVALVKNSGAEFGTVGWIGQLPDVDDDWIVGVIFDNMIGDCDGEYHGVRYFYARENYAMFVPLSSLTKTDNYIGRPETGTMLSRMSISLKPGQLLSIQRSSIRLQHCFLNAPHQRVGHDVRAVSNRLHCQCHNCGPCAHLTKQGRVSAIPPFGAHHAPNKKNSLAHAAVEILAHHHHHYHEEEHNKEEEYQFGDNAAHACNFVRYSCCQQNGVSGHDFSADCQMVRPELLDNLIHAPRAPHRRSRPRRAGHSRNCQQQQQLQQQQQQKQLTLPDQEHRGVDGSNFSSNFSTLDGEGKVKSWNVEGGDIPEVHDRSGNSSPYSSCSSRSSSYADDNQQNVPYEGQTYLQQQFEAAAIRNNGPNVYNTVDSRMSIADQQRFIYQRESTSVVQSTNYTDDYDAGGLSKSIRRCFDCIMGRKKRKKRKKPKKRKLSARNRLIEYRRKQSTFVPSTLAKPQEDFASHGFFLPVPSQLEGNSDYSSYSKSSSSSPSKSPDHNADGSRIKRNDPNESSYQPQTMTMEYRGLNSNDQLKSFRAIHNSEPARQLNYDDYTFSDDQYNKNGVSYDSALTDLGYCDSYTNSSNDTLKQIVDQTINDEVAPPEPLYINNPSSHVEISPLLSNNGSNSSEQVDVSSPTRSLVDEENQEEESENICQKIGCLNIDEDRDTSNQ